MEFNTKLSKLIARIKVIETRISNYKDKHNNIIKGCYIIK